MQKKEKRDAEMRARKASLLHKNPAPKAKKGHLFFTNTQTPGTLTVTARVLVALVFAD